MAQVILYQGVAAREAGEEMVHCYKLLHFAAFARRRFGIARAHPNNMLTDADWSSAAGETFDGYAQPRRSELRD
jgi:hypothetical protein